MNKKSTLKLMIIVYYNYKDKKYIRINDHYALLPVPERPTHWLQEQPVNILIYPILFSPPQFTGTGFTVPTTPTIYNKIFFSNYQMPIYYVTKS